MRFVAVSAVAALGVGLLPAVAVADGRPGLSLPGLKQPKAVPVKPVAIGGARRPNAAAGTWKAPTVVWPGAGSARVDLPTMVAAAGNGKSPQPSAGRKAGALPVTVAP